MLYMQVRHQGRSAPTGPRGAEEQQHEAGDQEAGGKGPGRGAAGWLRRQWPTLLLGGLFVWAVLRDRHRASAQPARMTVRR